MSKFIARSLIGACAAVACLMAGAAAAQVKTYSVVGAFTDGTGNMSGTFDYDHSTNTFTRVELTTTTGTDSGNTPFAGRTYTVVHTSLSPSFITFLTSAGHGSGAPFISFNFLPTMDQPNPRLRFVEEGHCLTNGCTSTIVYRGTGQYPFAMTEIVPTPVPTLSEWAMMLMGTLLAGGTALVLMRRMRAA